jgi:hypothetical protein
MKLRKNIKVAGLKGTWTTNMSDEDLQEFYRQCRARADEFRFKIGGVDVWVRVVALTARFKRGVCLWRGVGEKNTVTFHSVKEWALFKARQREIQELREEQGAFGISAAEFAWLERHLINGHSNGA